MTEQQPGEPTEPAPDEPAANTSDESAGQSSPKPKKSGLTRERIVIFGALGVLVVLALIDYRAKTAARNTGNAWREALKGKAFNASLRQSELTPYIEGSPRTSRRPLTAAEKAEFRLATEVETYTWTGILRNYKVEVIFGLGEDPSVEGINGPGDTVNADE